MKKYLAMIFAVLMFAVMSMGCGNSSPDATKAEKTTEAPKKREVVNYWHIHTGDEAAAEDKLIAAYNASQDKYEVIGLSMNDQQKLIVAMSSAEGPDVIFSSNSNLTTYYYNGLLEDLQEYFDRDKVDLAQWTDKALEACTFDGDLYAIPESGGSAIQMYYNIDLLKAAGYSEPPETM